MLFRVIHRSIKRKNIHLIIPGLGYDLNWKWALTLGKDAHVNFQNRQFENDTSSGEISKRGATPLSPVLSSNPPYFLQHEWSFARE